MVTKRFTGRAYALLWYGTVSTIIVAAVLMSLARVLLPLADDYRGRVEQWVSAQLGEPVRIGSMNVRLLGTSPTLIFSGVQLQESRDSGARFGELQFGFDPVASARRMSPVLNKVVIRGATLSIERLPSGLFRVRGLSFKGGDGQTGDNAALGTLLSSQPAVIIRDSSITWRDYRRGGESFAFKGLEIELNNRGERHRLDAEFRLPDKLGGPVRLAVDLEGDLFRPDLGRGTLHVSAEGWRPSPWLRALPEAGPDITGGNADVSLWANWDGGRIQSVSGSVAGRDFQISGSKGGGGVIDRFAAKGSWRMDEDGWRLELAGLDLERDGSHWRDGRIQAFGSSDGQVFRLKANRLLLADAADLARMWPGLSPEHRDLLAQAAPTGVVTGVRLNRDHGRMALQAKVEDLGVSPVRKLPGFSGLDGTFLYADGRGELRLDSRDADFSMPSLFRGPLPVDRLDGRIILTREGQRWRLSAPNLRLSNKEVDAEFALVVDNDGRDSPFIDLTGRFEGRHAERVAHYLPVGIMPPKSVEWLDQAFRAGRVPRGALLFHGRAGDFPFQEGQGRFLVRFDAEGVDLNYKPHWPLARDLSGHVEFDGLGLRVRADRGRILNSAVERVDVRVANLRRPLLYLNGSVKGSPNDLLEYLRQSGLVKGDALARFTAGGASSLSLKLRQPLSPRVSTAGYVRGEVKLLDARLQVIRGIALEQLNGTLKFDGVRVSSDRIDGQLLGEPLRISVYNEGRGKGLTTQVAFRGRLNGKRLENLADSPLLSRLYGTTPWQGVLAVPHGAAASEAELRLSSTLQGLGSALPAPFGKDRETRERLQVTFRPAQRRGEAVWERRLGLNFELSPEGALLRAAVDFNGRRPKLPAGKRLRITGSVDGLSPSQWQSLASGSEGPALDLPSIELDMDRVNIVRGAPADSDGSSHPPRPLPDMSVRVNALTYDDMFLGQVRFQGVNGDREFLLRDLEVKAPHLRAEGSGRWSFSDLPGKSSLKMEVRSDDLGGAMRDLRVASVIQDGEGTAKLSLGWPGGPADFALAGLSGSVRVDVKDGRIEEFDPGAGRLLGLLSLQALHRRLLLDFSDLFGSGMPFDDIKGNIQLADGNARTDNLRLDSLPASVYVTGRTGLKGRDYDHLITVVPQVSGTLPLAGGLWLGPQVGAALLIFQQLLGDRIDEGAQFQYRVTGGWDDPKVERVNGPAPKTAQTSVSAFEVE